MRFDKMEIMFHVNKDAFHSCFIVFQQKAVKRIC